MSAQEKLLHNHPLANIDRSQPLNKQLQDLHEVVKRNFAFISRIAVALYDDKIGNIKTFLSSGTQGVLKHYEISLNEVPTLKELAKGGQVRVVNDLELYQGSSEHTQKIKIHGYRASYTYPIMAHDEFLGIVFFNSYEANCFDEENILVIGLYAYIIGQMIMEEIYRTRSLLATLKTASSLMHYKDPETSNHIQRMARYTRLIAKELAQTNKYDFTDEYIERIFLYAPLHDIGKIAVPDEILQKKGKLNEEEWKVMQAHTIKGREIIDNIFENLGFLIAGDAEIIRCIAEQHHETIDGLGYPHGLKEEQVSIAARIVSVADIFDALTSERPYKKAWSNEAAIAQLKKLSGEKLDRDCVQALIDNLEEVENIQKLFIDEN
ncbi:HD domain-containing phosphohydrolase [Candidatus Uabimicrobium amorphum]|uniref:Transcriptional regulator n=2 Tax=Uabimicrobium amorphum TaxID=2596890 RepID=A0A5S9F3G0_UABAM|nr:transcriptional regulator [Candidatus Uabimicrobium amorphum]